LHTADKDKGMGAYNGAVYSNPEIDKMIIDSSSIIDRAEREKALQAINKKSVDDVAWIPLHYQQDIYAVVKAFGGQVQPRPDQWVVAKEIK
jgi:peptide/nickel transport system substrate-binding protein